MIFLNITKRLDTAEGILQAHFELKIEDGEFITLFGPSGAGKTTLMRMIAGLEKPDSGVIEVDGEVWFDSTKKINLPPQKRSIGFVFQDYALFPTMSVRENLLFAADNSEQRSNIDELIELVELTALSDRLPSTLSGGQKQRVALARALVRRPKILLLDEPLSALDPLMRQKLQDELTLIHQRLGVTTLLVSHDIAETVKLSDRLASVESGRIKSICPPMEFFSPQALSGKLQLIGEVLKIEEDSPAVIVTLLVGSSVVRTVLSSTEASELRVGGHAIISTKAFNPILIPLP
ncbi:ABC transporter ATP-binding protein [Sulfuricurvum sp.]|uniref:ABC transporter ATP-binding protein n=1 Tax=Sulfuricurvum sp. TaxID=2025608 RepID=UPI002633278C|nr:ATP-binding cassette domain-containing protein [Sulfuricurvum sp.]MDD2267262.1 ATP-binding cassette domain-containing protein [Sulfuricurvum sp.]MDD2784400.1 ATP-binding cassette domain-containing protein [Sulfuricurvum sp.]HZF70033.1 ATP-binding cassette domain-containing protein [Sulfuricurvum sp.]